MEGLGSVPTLDPCRPEATDKEVNDESSSRAIDTDSLENHSSVTRRERIMRKPFQYRLNFCSFPEGSASQQGEVVSQHQIEKGRHVRKLVG